MSFDIKEGGVGPPRRSSSPWDTGTHPRLGPLNIVSGHSTLPMVLTRKFITSFITARVALMIKNQIFKFVELPGADIRSGAGAKKARILLRPWR
jgi:hypothetical protein